MADTRWQKIFDYIDQMKTGNIDPQFSLEGHDELVTISQHLSSLAKTIETNTIESNLILQITEKISEGLLPSDIFKYIYQTFRSIIPYNRIGIALLDPKKENLSAFWAKSDAPTIQIYVGYSAKMEGSSLQKILEAKKPRILNNLEQYLQEHPTSESTGLIVKEGMKSSLTCPLIALGNPIGFMFFSSVLFNTFRDAHVEMFLKIASLVSNIIEKSRLYENLQELDSLKTKFLGIAAHDLRNPLQVIKGNIDFMEMLGDIPPNQKETIQTIKRQTDKMIDLIKTFLDVSVIESGHLTLNKANIPFQKFLEKSIEDLRWLTKGKNIQIVLQNNEPDVSVSFDPVRIDQVLNNLISNAVKFSPSNTTITIQAKKENSSMVVSVSDEGQGIPKEEIKNLFTFFTTSSTKPLLQKESSTGLGLAISKKIIEAHSGRMEAKNNDLKGTTFTFYLPLVS
ncbi:MAG: ATP-binding protein [Chlamydiota bacterium]